MGKKEILKFDDVEIEKGEFHSSKNTIPIDDVNIDKVVISDQFSWIIKGSRYFISYKNNEKPHHCVSCFQKWAGM